MVSTILEKMILYFNDDIRRISHALKVYGFSKAIAGGEALSEDLNVIVELAAVLHDIGIKEAERKYHSSAGKYQELEGPPIAAEILSTAGVEPAIRERVCYLIGNHHSYDKIEGLDFQILVEADFIVNIAEEGLSSQVAENIREKYFKTAAGSRIVENLFGL
jgi:HD superfamily phosphodiesterase